MSKWIHIWYSWGDFEPPIAVDDSVDAWQYAKHLAVEEAETAYQGNEEFGEIGLCIDSKEEKISLHYPMDDTYCYYKVADTVYYEPDQENTQNKN